MDASTQVSFAFPSPLSRLVSDGTDVCVNSPDSCPMSPFSPPNVYLSGSKEGAVEVKQFITKMDSRHLDETYEIVKKLQDDSRHSEIFIVKRKHQIGHYIAKKTLRKDFSRYWY